MTQSEPLLIRVVGFAGVVSTFVPVEVARPLPQPFWFEFATGRAPGVCAQRAKGDFGKLVVPLCSFPRKLCPEHGTPKTRHL